MSATSVRGNLFDVGKCSPCEKQVEIIDWLMELIDTSMIGQKVLETFIVVSFDIASEC